MGLHSIACRLDFFNTRARKKGVIPRPKFKAERSGSVGFVLKLPEGGSFEQLNNPDIREIGFSIQ